MTWIGIAGYGLTALAFLFLFLLLLTTPRQSIQRKILIAASVFSCIWAASLTFQIFESQSLIPFLGLESVKNLLWLLLIISAFSNATSFIQILLERRRTQVLCLGFVGLIAVEASFSLTGFVSAYYVLCAHLVQSILGLWLVEQFYRLVPEQTRWTIKPLCLALAAQFAFDFVMFADAVLLLQLDFTFWYARGWLSLATVPFILISTRRAQHWETRIYVSRDVVYHSTLLLAAGGYLLLMSLVGYFLTYIGGEWGTVLQAIFVALGVLVLGSLFLSESFRQNIKVFITKHFFANKYEYREEWLKIAEILNQDVSGDNIYKTALSAMQQTFNSDFALLAIKRGPQWQVLAHENCEPDKIQQTVWLNDIAEFSLKNDWIFDAEEYRRQPPKKRKLDLAIDEVDTCKMQLSIPVTNGRELNAILLLSKPKSTMKVNWEDRDLMKAISKQIATFLHLHLTSLKLAESKQFDAFNRMSAFLVHDLKNVQAQLSLITSNAERHRENQAFVDDAFETMGHAETRLSKVLDQLRNKRLEGSKQQKKSIAQLIEEVVAQRQGQQPKPAFSHKTDTQLSLDTSRFKSVLTHIIQNAQEATPAEGEVTVSMREQGEHLIIDVKDNGCGMSQDFVEHRLFKPFDTTKGNAGMGIGVYEARQYFESAGGDITVESEENAGTTFNLMLPLFNEV